MATLGNVAEHASQRHVAFGQVLRALRLKRGLSQEELGFQSGLHRNYVGGIERGELNPSLTNIFKLADALDCPPSEIFRRAERS